MNTPSIYQIIKSKCFTKPLCIDTTNKPFIDDELECKLIKKDGKTRYELNVYDNDTYRSVFSGKYCTLEIENLVKHMLDVFTEETKECTDTIYLYLYYDPTKQRFVHQRFK